MSLLGIIETLRRNLKAVIGACIAVLVLLVVADIARVTTGFGSHTAAPAGEHAVAPAAEHNAHAAATPEHAAPAAHGTASAAHGEAHGFWAKAYHIAETVPVFWTLFGFLGCVLIVVVSKSYGHFGVSVKEDYYSE
jgi:hypothetical protein